MSIRIDRCVGRFSIQEKTFTDGSIYRASGPGSKLGQWWEDERECLWDLLAMARETELTDEENEAAIGWYEYIYNL